MEDKEYTIEDELIDQAMFRIICDGSVRLKIGNSEITVTGKNALFGRMVPSVEFGINGKRSIIMPREKFFEYKKNGRDIKNMLKMAADPTDVKELCEYIDKLHTRCVEQNTKMLKHLAEHMSEIIAKVDSGEALDQLERSING